MNKLLLTIVGICLIAIGLSLIPVIAQDNPSGLQGDDSEVYVSAGAFISLQGDDSEIYVNRSNLAANPLSVMQGDDSQIFVAQNPTGDLQGDDVEIFTSSSNQVVNATTGDEDTVETVVEPDLAASLPAANRDVLDNVSDNVGSGLPDTQLSNWQETPVDNRFLMIGGGMALALILIASIFVASGTLKAASR